MKNQISSTNIKSYKDILERQAGIEKEIWNTFYSGKYFLEEPLIIVNPYKDYPLTAAILFKTEESVSTDIILVGKDNKESIICNSSELKQVHTIAVAGLYANYNNELILKTKSIDGVIRSKRINIQTKCNYKHLGTFEILKNNIAEKVFYIIEDRYRTVVDSDGEIRWITNQLSLVNVGCRLKNGNIIVSTGGYHSRYSYLYEIDWIGKIYSIYVVPNGAHHHCEELLNGNLLIASNSGDLENVEDVIVEIDRKTGKVIKEFNLNKLLPIERKTLLYNSQKIKEDHFHTNAVCINKDAKSILVSCRYQDAVIKFDYDTLKIQWILGNGNMWSEEYKDKLLTPVSDDFKWQYGQHCPVILNETEDYMDIMMFDNGNYREYNSELTAHHKDNYSRCVVFRVDENKKSIDLIWEYGKERGIHFFSYKKGNCAYDESIETFLINSVSINYKINGIVPRSDYNEQMTVLEVKKDSKEVLFEMNHYLDCLKNPAYRVYKHHGSTFIKTNILEDIQINDFTYSGTRVYEEKLHLDNYKNDCIWDISSIKISNKFLKLRGYIYVKDIPPIELDKYLVLINERGKSYIYDIKKSSNPALGKAFGDMSLEHSDINIVRFPIDILPEGNYTVNFLLKTHENEYFATTGYYFKIQDKNDDAK